MPRAPWPALVAALVGLACAGCSHPAGDAADAVHAAGADRKVKLNLEEGPVEELTVLRDTAGRILVAGLCFFPDSTRLTVVLYDSTGRFLARTQPVVDKALFRSLPLGDDLDRGWPPGRYVIELAANFAAGAQSPRVVRAAESSRALRGEGMTRSRQGHPAYVRRFQVRL